MMEVTKNMAAGFMVLVPFCALCAGLVEWFGPIALPWILIATCVAAVSALVGMVLRG